MDIKLFQRILTEIKGYTEHLYFHVMGEPLLHPELGAFLDICFEQGFKVNITTNGTLISKLKNELSKKRAVRAINFSLHIFKKNTKKTVVDEYLDGVFDFIKSSGYTPNFIICLRLWNTDIKDPGLNTYILDKIKGFFDISEKIENIPQEGNGIRLKNNIYLSQRTLFDWPDKKGEDIKSTGFCLGLRNQAAILSDGTVVPCCLDSDGTISLGNIKTDNFRDIIEGERAMKLYHGFSERKAVESLCRKCGYRKRFDLV